MMSKNDTTRIWQECTDIIQDKNLCRRVDGASESDTGLLTTTIRRTNQVSKEGVMLCNSPPITLPQHQNPSLRLQCCSCTEHLHGAALAHMLLCRLRTKAHARGPLAPLSHVCLVNCENLVVWKGCHRTLSCAFPCSSSCNVVSRPDRTHDDGGLRDGCEAGLNVEQKWSYTCNLI